MSPKHKEKLVTATRGLWLLLYKLVACFDCLTCMFFELDKDKLKRRKGVCCLLYETDERNYTD